MSLYVDGCSFAAASGLEDKYKLANLLGADADMSKEGKSNMQIVKDLQDNINDYDEFVLEFTFSNRFVVFYEGKHRRPLHILPHPADNFFATEEEYSRYTTFHKFYYQNMNLDFTNRLADFYVDGSIALLKAFNKKYVIYTTEERNSAFATEINQLSFNRELLNQDLHFNEDGMRHWANDARRRLDE